MMQFAETFGERVNSVLKQNHLAPNAIEALSERRISHQTVRRMLKGYVPGSDLIIAFAEAVGKAMEWTPRQTKDLADELLAMVDSRARYYASVMHPSLLNLRPAGSEVHAALL